MQCVDVKIKHKTLLGSIQKSSSMCDFMPHLHFLSQMRQFFDKALC